MAANSRRSVPPEEMAVRPQAGGWAGAAVLALVVVLLAVLAAGLLRGGVAVEPAFPGSPGALWGAFAVTWGLALVLAGELSPNPPRRFLSGSDNSC